jgi:hypothetical protein
MTGVTLAGVAGEVSSADEVVMQFLPEVTTICGFIPGAQVATPFLAMAGPLLLALDNACKSVVAGNPGAAAETVLQEVISHLTPGLPNSPILSAPTA